VAHLLEEIAKAAATYEGETWAGLANVLGFVVILKLLPTVTLTERAAKLLVRLVEGSRSYRARKHGFEYVPYDGDEAKAPEPGLSVKATITVCGYLLLSVGIIAAVDKLGGGVR
jgi:hypothetical protein